MVRKTLYIIAGSFICLTLSSQKIISQSKKHNKLQQKFNKNELNNVLILGDSVAKGYKTDDGGITQKLANKLANHSKKDINVSNKGVIGLTSHDLLKNIENGQYEQEISAANIIILNIGGNDLLDQFKKDGAKSIVKHFTKVRRQFRNNLSSIIDLLQAQNNDAIIIGNQLYNSINDNHSYYGLADFLFLLWNKSWKEQPILVTKTTKMNRKENYWLDKVHPNKQGYDKMTDIIYADIKKYL